VNGFLEENEDEKLIVFADHLEVQAQFASGLREHAPLLIKGTMGSTDRQAAIGAFQRDPKRRVIICSLKAGSTAVTLHAASTMLFAELDWSPAILDQAESRAHRLGQKNPVTSFYLLARGTIDEHMWATLQHKAQLVDAVNGREATVATMERTVADEMVERVNTRAGGAANVAHAP
jgi:SWI/SNF-related matrix-associated actin-dependent regulator 1 of chromatin subfamily A